MKKIKLVIFDMDGLMFETGRLAYRAYLSAAENMILKFAKKFIII